MGARSVPYPISILIGSGRASANNRIEGNGRGKGGGKRNETTRCRRGSLGWRARRVARPGGGVHLPQRMGGFAPCSSVPLLCGTSLRTRRIPGARGGSPPFLSEILPFGPFFPFLSFPSLSMRSFPPPSPPTSKGKISDACVRLRSSDPGAPTTISSSRRPSSLRCVCDTRSTRSDALGHVAIAEETTWPPSHACPLAKGPAAGTKPHVSPRGACRKTPGTRPEEGRNVGRSGLTEDTPRPRTRRTRRCTDGWNSAGRTNVLLPSCAPPTASHKPWKRQERPPPCPSELALCSHR